MRGSCLNDPCWGSRESAEPDDAPELDNVRVALACLAEAVEYHCEMARPSERVRAALNLAWFVLGEAEYIAARMRAGCCDCGGKLDDPQDDLCARCAEADE